MISEQSSLPNFTLNTLIPRLYRVLGSKSPCNKRKFMKNLQLPLPPLENKHFLVVFSVCSFFVQRLRWKLLLVLPLSTHWTSCGKFRRPVGFVEQFWMLLSFEGSLWYIFILEATLRICETPKWELADGCRYMALHILVLSCPLKLSESELLYCYFYFYEEYKYWNCLSLIWTKYFTAAIL